MRAYKTVVWDGQEYSVPVEMKWLTVDSDGEINVWTEKPVRVLPRWGGTFWYKAPHKRGQMMTLEVPKVESYLDLWEELLIEI